MSTYKRNTDFVVTHSIPCPQCNELKPEKEITKRYIGINWTPLLCCEQCYQSAKAEDEQARKAYLGDIYGY